MPQSDIDKDAFDFGLNLKKLRKSRGWTQEEFSKILGVHKDMVSKYENNLKTPSLERIIKIAQIFHISIDSLLGLDRSSSTKIYGLTEKEKRIFDDFVNTFLNK